MPPQSRVLGRPVPCLPLFIVVHFDDGEDAAKFVFEAIDGFGSYDTVQVGHFVPEIDERFVRSR